MKSRTWKACLEFFLVWPQYDPMLLDKFGAGQRAVKLCGWEGNRGPGGKYCQPSAGFTTMWPVGWLPRLGSALGLRLRSHRRESEYLYIRFPVNTSLHVFQWRPFTLIRVLYEYRLPVNFTHASRFCAGRVLSNPYDVNSTKFVWI